jgi:hypothetical protein
VLPVSAAVLAEIALAPLPPAEIALDDDRRRIHATRRSTTPSTNVALISGSYPHSAPARTGNPLPSKLASEMACPIRIRIDPFMPSMGPGGLPRKSGVPAIDG